MIPFVFLIPLLVIGIVLFSKAGKTRRWGRVVAVLLLLLFVSVVAIRSHSSRAILVSSDYIKSIKRQQIQPTAPVPPVWLPGIEDQFEADVYPSRLSATRALGLRMEEPIRSVLEGAELPGKIAVVSYQESFDNTLVSALGNALESRLPGTRCFIESRTNNDIVQNEVWVSVRQTASGEVPNGKIVATIHRGRKRNFEVDAGFCEKLWVENFAEFLNRNPKDKWILAHSQESCVSQAEAEEQAMKNACDRVAQLLNQTRPQRSAMGAGFNVNPADIRNGNFISDRFAQSFAGTAGRIWRQAILINASQDKLAKLAGLKMSRWQLRRTSWARELISIVGVMILICVVYLFLNAATRGYYTWSLRIAAVVLTVVGILLIFTLS